MTSAAKKPRKVTTYTLRVTTKELGMREFAFVSKRMAKFYSSLWLEAGHNVEWL